MQVCRVAIFYNKECDYVKFNKVITKEASLVSYADSYETKGTHFKYDKGYGSPKISSGIKLFTEFFSINNTLTDPLLKKYWTIIAPTEEEICLHLTPSSS